MLGRTKGVEDTMESWPVNPRYNGWVSTKSEFAGKCSCLSKDIDISSMGEAALKSLKKSRNLMIEQ